MEIFPSGCLWACLAAPAPTKGTLAIFPPVAEVSVVVAADSVVLEEEALVVGVLEEVGKMAEL